MKAQFTHQKIKYVLGSHDFLSRCEDSEMNLETNAASEVGQEGRGAKPSFLQRLLESPKPDKGKESPASMAPIFLGADTLSACSFCNNFQSNFESKQGDKIKKRPSLLRNGH